MSAAAGVDALHLHTGGRWLVITATSQHVWDLDRRTYRRVPGPNGPSFDYDRVEHPITRVERYPEVGSRSIVWFDDPRNGLMELWRVSSTIRSITQMDPGAESSAAP